MSTYTPVTACCGETEPTNPKRDLFRQHRQTGLQLYNVSNPIPDEISDGADLRGFFKKWRLIPFAGTTDDSGQSLLLWYLMLAQLSPTHSACISKKVKYAVGGKGTFVQSVDPQWDTGEDDQPLPPAQKVNCREMFNKYIRFEDGVTNFHRRIARSYEATGNAWVEMIYADTLGEKVVTMKAHRVTHCLYQETKPGQERVVVISPVWTDDYLKKNEPRYLNTYPKFTKYPDGTLRTIFHLKNGENSWYGRPETSGADIYKYREVQDSIYLTKQAGANFTGQMIIEVEDDNPEFSEAIDDKGAQKAGYDSFADRMEANYTARADDPQTIMVTARPYGSKPMFVFQVAPNTNENFYKVTGEQAAEYIRGTHGVTARFMGKDVANGFSTEVFISDYVMLVEPVINDLREEITRFTNTAITAAWLELLNLPEMNDYSVTFAAPIQSAVDDFKSKSTAPALSKLDQKPVKEPEI